MTYEASSTLFFIFMIMMMIFIVLVSPLGKPLGTQFKRRSLNTRYSQLDPLVRQVLADTDGDRTKAARKLRRKTLLPAATINTLLSLYTDHA